MADRGPALHRRRRRALFPRDRALPFTATSDAHPEAERALLVHRSESRPMPNGAHVTRLATLEGPGPWIGLGLTVAIIAGLIGSLAASWVEQRRRGR